jgi:hypothetical protein
MVIQHCSGELRQHLSPEFSPMVTRCWLDVLLPNRCIGPSFFHLSAVRCLWSPVVRSSSVDPGIRKCWPRHGYCNTRDAKQRVPGVQGAL